MKNTSIFVVATILLHSLFLGAQPGYEILKDVKKIEIPFEYKNNLLVVNVTFNRIFPLKFIFDTGAEHTILSRREFADLLGIPFEREFKIIGSDMKTELTAYLVRGIHLRLSDMIVPYHSLLVLQDDYFRFEEMAGLEVHGILGADVFRGLIVKIDYQRNIITLTKSKGFTAPDNNYLAVPIDIYRNKPYIETVVRIQQDTSIPVRLLLDTGAMLSLMLNTDTHPDLKLPPQVIKGKVGAGLGGIIEGYLGRVTSLDLGSLACNQIITNFQELAEGVDTTALLGRNGVIGNQILSRFNIIIDYPREMLYLRPNKNFKKAFEYDKSGLVVIAADIHLNKFIVNGVIPGSPAEIAGILPGDEIRRINWAAASMLSLTSIQNTFSGKEGKQITVVVKRNGKKIKTTFHLRSQI
jgi:hypothetical protein